MPCHNSLLRNAFHFAAVGMALVGLDGKWLRVNRALCNLLGYSEAELQELSFQNITHPDDLYLDLAYVGQMLRGEIATYEMEKRYIRKNGETVWALLQVALARNESNEPEVFISQVTDITSRKIAEEQREQTSRENRRLLAAYEERTQEMDAFRAQLFSVCAWTKRIFYDGRWMAIDEFLSEHLRLKLTHSISEEALKGVLEQLQPGENAAK